MKAGTLLVLTFASGGGAGVYWSTSAAESKHDARAPSPGVETLSANNRAAPQDEPELQASPGRTLVSTLPVEEEDAEAHPHARSAADVLWALEKAYQDQERRISSLEAALEERLSEETEPELPSHPAYAALPPPSQDSVQGTSPTLAPAASADHRHESQVVIHIHEPREHHAAQEKSVQQAPATAEAPATEQMLAAQQVLVLQHFQPFIISDQAFAPSRYGRRLDPRATRNYREQSLMRQNFQQGSSMTNSWVASGFDVYSNR